MGWELRHANRYYLYRNCRVDGKPVKQYLACSDKLSYGEQIGDCLVVVQQEERRLRTLKRNLRQQFRQEIDTLVNDSVAANQKLLSVIEGLLYTLGFHKHNRGEWRMQRIIKELENLNQERQAQRAKTVPMIHCVAPKDDAEALALFEQARNGDRSAQLQIHELIRDRKLQDVLGDLGKQSTEQLFQKSAGGDPVWKAAITEKARIMRDELLGSNPSILEELLVRRIINGWVAVYTLELEQTRRPPIDRRDREHLDKALSRAERRYTQAIRELARVRKLQAPVILTRMGS